MLLMLLSNRVDDMTNHCTIALWKVAFKIYQHTVQSC